MIAATKFNNGKRTYEEPNKGNGNYNPQGNANHGNFNGK